MNSVRWLSGFAVAVIAGSAFGAEPQIKTIILPEVSARSGPSDQYYATSTLRLGDPVDVVGLENGMLKIKPPIDSFDWVNEADVTVVGSIATVTKTTHLYRGSGLAPLKDLNQFQPEDLVAGMQLAVLPAAPHKVGRETLIRVNPPTTDFRYIPVNAVENSQGRAAPPAANMPVMPSTFGPTSGQPDMTAAFGQQSSLPPAPMAAGQLDTSYATQTPGEQQNPRHNRQGGTGQPQGPPKADAYNGQQARAGQPQGQPRADVVNGQWTGQPQGQPKTEFFIGQQGTQPIQPMNYAPPYAQQENPVGGSIGNSQFGPPPPQDGPQPAYGLPATNSAGGRRGQVNTGTGVLPAYGNNSAATSRSNQRQGSLSDDPMWLEGERFEGMGDLDSAVRCYDEVGRTYGQIDPNLALRAMNRAQYLRNEISAGVAPAGPLTRSAKPSYNDTAVTNVYPNFYGQQTAETRQRPITTAQTDVYSTTPSQYLPFDTNAARTNMKPPANKVEELAQPNARLTKPLTGYETTSSKWQTVTVAGILEKTAMDLNGKRFYRLRPDNPKTSADIIYCTNLPAINLEEVVNRHVVISGPWSYHKELRQNYMEVAQVTLSP